MIGVVVDGCPAGVSINIEKIQLDLARRRPGQSEITTGRQEKDEVEILSGLFNGKTTGAPIAMMIRNADTDSSEYEKRRFTPRPSHADYPAFVKYGGFEDYRGGGRFSARITAGFVMAGSIAKQFLENSGVQISSKILEIGDENDPTKYKEKILEAKKIGDTVGGIIQGIATGLPVGLGEPVFDRLDAELAKALFCLPAVKGVEFGSGFEGARKLGSENNDALTFTPSPGGRGLGGGAISTKTNHAGGVVGGLSNGMPLVVNIAFKPIASIAKPQETIDLQTGEKVLLETKGRFDPCPIPRALPMVEAMIAIVLADLALRKKTLTTIHKN